MSNQTVSDVEVFESCATLHAGPDLTVAATGEVTLRAADRIVFYDGFHVEAGGRLDADIDPTLTGDVTKTYGYQDVDYFLTSAAGPWGSQSWTYDKIGNRTSETRRRRHRRPTTTGHGVDTAAVSKVTPRG